MSKVLTKAGAAVQAQARMQKAVVYTVLLYGIDIWVVTGATLIVLEGFHHQVARKILVKIAWYAGDSGWECPPVE